MKFWITLSALLLGGAISAASAAGCDNPPLVQLPAAEKAGKKESSKKEMEKEQGKAKEAMEKYYTALQAYVACTQEALKSAGGDNAPALYKSVLVSRNNAAVAEWEAVQKWYASLFGASPVGPPAGPPGEKNGK
jgi:hypothetical protein